MNELLHYSADLFPLVLRGIKTSTIRKTTRLTPGDTVINADTTGAGTLPARVTSVRRIDLAEMSICLPIRIYVDGVRLSSHEMRALAAREGFGGAVILMLRRIETLYALPFSGVLIEWEPSKTENTGA